MRGDEWCKLWRAASLATVIWPKAVFHSDGIIFDMRIGFWENKPPKAKLRLKLIPYQIHGPGN
jgi:hypothetical protein